MVVEGKAAELLAEGLGELSHRTVESNDRAIALLGRALELDPSMRDAHLALGRALRIKGSLSEESQL